jgi:hypothetical protein
VLDITLPQCQQKMCISEMRSPLSLLTFRCVLCLAGTIGTVVHSGVHIPASHTLPGTGASCLTNLLRCIDATQTAW